MLLPQNPVGQAPVHCSLFTVHSPSTPAPPSSYTSRMDLTAKLDILSAAARYDASCSSSGSRRPAQRGGIGNGAPSGVCHSWADDGRCISLLKILLSNQCIHDCAYCLNRRSNPQPRAAFTVDEVVRLTIEFYRRNYIEGLFLSSGIMRDEDYTMEQLVAVVRRLRVEERFHGYIHLKAIPGASDELIRQAGLYTDRLSVNIELPSECSLRRLAPGKTREGILRPMKAITQGIAENRAERKTTRRAPLFVPAGQSTQLIVGATPESDQQILNLASGLYGHYGLKRVYYSAFVPVNQDARLVPTERPDLLREHRLYQADWLVRLYGFGAGELLSADHPFLDRELDPKTAWALAHPECFPVDVRRADYQTLLRVPGIGFKSAARIVSARRFAPVRPEDLPRLGVVMKRARYFIVCGPALLPPHLATDRLRLQLIGTESGTSSVTWTQPELFEPATVFA